MPGENNEGKPKNSFADALSQESLDGMREVAKENLKGQLETKISDDLGALALAEKDPSFKNSAEIQQIKKELEATLEKIKALENPTEVEVTSLEANREALSNKLSEATQTIEQEPTQITPPPIETEPSAPPQPPKEKGPIFVKGTRDEELAGRIEAETIDQQKEQISLVIERLSDQKSKLENIFLQTGTSTDRKGLIGRAIKETGELIEEAKSLKDENEILTNENKTERLWARIEKNLDIISEELLVPTNLPIESSSEGDRMTRELEQRLQTAQEPQEKMDIDLGEEAVKTPPPLFEITPEEEKAHEERLKLNQLVDEAFRLYQENLNTRDVNDSQKSSDDLVRESVSYLIDKAVASGIMESKEAVTELKKRIAEQSGNTEDETRDNTPFKQENYPPSLEADKEPATQELSAEEKAKATEVAKQLFKLHQELSRNKKNEDTFSLSDEIDKKVNELIPDNEELRLLALTELVSMLYDHEFEMDQVAIENIEASESTEIEIPRELIGQLNKTEAEPTTAEAELIAKVETIADVENLPEATKEKVSSGLWSIGFAVKEKVNGFIGEQVKNQAEKRHKESAGKNEADSFVTRLLFAAAEKYNKDAKDATQKRADIAAGGSKRIIGQSAYVGGRVLRYGRLLADAAGWTSGAAFAPYTRVATALGMMAESGFDIAKEAQLRQEKFLEQDSEKAAEAAWEIYNKLKDEQKREPTRAELEQSYKEKLPQDILDRLDKGKESGIGSQTMQKLFGIWIENSMLKMQEDLDKVEENNSIKPENKELEKQKIYNNFSIRLKDFDRALNDTGKVDTAAMTFKLLSSAGKWMVRAVAVESVFLVFGKAAEALGSAAENSDGKFIEEVENALKINSKDGLSNEEAVMVSKLIRSYAEDGELDEANFLKNHYSALLESSSTTGSSAEVPTELSKVEVEENIKTINDLKSSDPERAKQMLEYYADVKVEGSNLSLKDFFEHPEKLQDIKIGSASVTETIKPFRFENPIAGNQDSIWFSTEQSFRMNPDRFGFDATKDGTV
ncbi:MAG: hypothetical protein Q8Q90_02790, partial [bacterium]|nr:hypothetical protein [bacterium]